MFHKIWENNKKWFRHSRGRFTLIELFGYCDQTAILAAMLLPALSSARVWARASNCISNLKQVGLAFNVYAGNNKDRTPPPAMPYKETFAYWPGLLSDPSDGNFIWIHYGMNEMLSNTGIRLGRVANPSRLLQVVDNYYDPGSGLGLGYFSVPRIFSYATVDGRHNGVANVLFADGHAEGVRTGMAGTLANDYTSARNPYNNAPFNEPLGALWVPNP